MASAVLALFLAGCGEDEDATVALKSVKISPEAEVSLVVEGTQQFTATPEPANATDVKITWDVSDKEVISVANDGLVTAKAVGEATVWASSGDVQSKKVTVKVTLKALTSFTVAPAELPLEVGDAPVQLTITKTPTDAGGTFTYATGNDEVVTVSATGLVTVEGAGNTNITVTSGSIVVTVPVTVTLVTPTPDEEFNRDEWTVTTSSVWQAGFEGEKMLDDDLFSYWHTDAGPTGIPASFTVDMKGNKLIEGFYLIHRKDIDQTANPKAITIDVSLNAETWVQVYQTNDLSQDKTEAIELDLDEEIVARYFRVNITATAVGAATYTYLAEIGAYNEDEPYDPPEVEEGNTYTLSFSETGVNNITLTPGEGFVTISTTGSDPNIGTTTIGRVLGGTTAKLRFEYKSNQAVTDAEFFWCVAGGPEGGKSTGASVSIPQAADWTPFEYDLATAKSSFGFGSSPAHYIRFDPTGAAGYEISIKKLRIETDETTP
ncbi:MAG: Ig-like domain-containing protein [Bacteroidales bacterium]|nr:Ig-like domain-containing protein [Bacteroidales bacterium]